MALRYVLPLLLALPLALGALPAADAAPVDAKVGETRTTYKRSGTPLRASPDALAKPIQVLPKGTAVTVLEVNLPWLRVQAGQATGWVQAPEVVLATALRPNPLPTYRTDRGTGRVSQTDAAAAGRQFDEATEKRYRVSRADLQRGYALVDQMEAMTHQLDPADSVEFIIAGFLGRRGRDYALPGRLPRSPPKRSSSGGSGGKRIAGEVGRRLGGLLGKELGGSKGERLGRGLGEGIAESLHGMRDLADQLNRQFTPEQEYYLGRAVMAKTLAQTGFAPEMEMRMYVKRLGDAIVRLSDRVPANFGGYHFDVLDSDEINGISGPGGFVLITRGAVKACQTEDELAGVLCHELAHITRRHAESILRKGKVSAQHHKNFMNILVKASGVGDARIAQGLLNWFGASVDDLHMTASSRGYGRQLEFDADLEGSNLLFDVYYDHMALRDLLVRMGQTGRGHGHGGTHADPAARAQWLTTKIAGYRPFTPRDGVKEARLNRFQLTAIR